jgi:hypothetical protein
MSDRLKNATESTGSTEATEAGRGLLLIHGFCGGAWSSHGPDRWRSKVGISHHMAKKCYKYYLTLRQAKSYDATMGEPFSESLRRAIRECGMTRYAISVRTGIDQATLSRFMKGERGLSLSAIDKLVEALGLEIRTRRKRKDG